MGQKINDSIFSEDFKPEPFWWENTPRPKTGANQLPADADVVIIGSGYTGLSAGIQTAHGGRHTVVVDAEDAGWGCSSRNGGQVSTSIKPSFELLARRFGADAAMNILQEGNNALSWIASFIEQNNISCNFSRVGRFHGAHTEKDMAELREKVSTIPDQLGFDARIIEPQDQFNEIGSDFYHGGIVYPHHASLDPAKYHQGLFDLAQKKGVQIICHCKVGDIDKRGSGFEVTTSRGTIRAKDVIVATSGYTGSATPWQQRRIIPIGSYIIATEPLPEDQIKRLIPNDRVMSDTRKLVVYYRTCTERRRILFGGRVSLNETDPRISAPRLHQQLTQLFPELGNVKVSHSWMGFVGYTFDEMPHIGQFNGIYYSMGYCGSGVSLASYFGTRIGQQVVGDPEGLTSLDGLPFDGRFYYRKKPWFLAPSIFYYRWKDQSANREPK